MLRSTLVAFCLLFPNATLALAQQQSGQQPVQQTPAQTDSKATLEVPSVVPPKWPDPVKARNAEMKRRVDAWLNEGKDSQASAPLHVVYLTCKDQTPFANHQERLNRVLTEIQTWFAAQQESLGFGPTTFALARNDTGLVTLHEGTLPFTVGSRSRDNIRETSAACHAAAKALLAKAGVDYDHSFVLVLTTIPDDHGAAPFFGNIIQDRGYCFAVDTPWLDLNYTQKDGPAVWKGKPVGAANSALIGGMAHELGHGFGLPHSDEPESLRALGESLMGSGNYTWREELRGRSLGSFLLDTDAMLLVSRPPFTANTRDLDKQPAVRLEDVKLIQEENGEVVITGRIDTNIPCYAIKLFDDPPGNNDYNAVAHAALPEEATGAFAIRCKPMTARGDHELRLVLFHVNGRWTQYNSRMNVSESGVYLSPA